MGDRQFEVSASKFVKKCVAVIVIGSWIPGLVFMISEYIYSLDPQSYPTPVPGILLQLVCIPILAYQLPAYIISGVIGINLVKGGRIKSAVTAYLGVGIAGWFVSTLLLSIMSINGTSFPASTALKVAFIGSLPSLLLYLVFFFPKRVKA